MHESYEDTNMLSLERTNAIGEYPELISIDLTNKL